MIEASIKALPGLFVSFLVLAVLLCLPTWLIARRRGRPVSVRVMLAASLAGIAAVTLLPGNAGTAGEGMCDASWSLTDALNSSSAWMNLALFVPAAFFAVALFRRPITTVGAGVLLSGAIEWAQTGAVPGRSCTMTDFVMNSTGAVVGAVAAQVWLLVRRNTEGTWRPVKDAGWAVGVTTAGALALVGLFNASDPQTYDAAALHHRQQQEAQASFGSSQWITTASKSVFGERSELQQIQEDKKDGHLVITATTDRGKLIAWWPEKKLIQSIPKDNRAEAGPVRQHQAVQIGARFAKKWFTDEIDGAKLTTHVLGRTVDNHAVYQLTYRRYSDGLMMPMRLDISITSAGRIIGFTARPIPDPAMPKSTVSKAAAEDLVRRRTNVPPVAAVLLAQKVKETWRPVWMIGMPDGAKEPDLFIDAVTGQKVIPDGA
ncbi:VanZ family protein [Streptomyces sp. NPDC050085]|uniref:VanZ family protein n=1 Tax=Streptomyces sp. NPDC050085 TaxID=3365600 RepID=UPI00378CBD34